MSEQLEERQQESLPSTSGARYRPDQKKRQSEEDVSPPGRKPKLRPQIDLAGDPSPFLLMDDIEIEYTAEQLDAFEKFDAEFNIPEREIPEHTGSLDRSSNDVSQQNLELQAVAPCKEPIAREANLPRMASSYWSVGESTEFPLLLSLHGTNWEQIADRLRTKTPLMVSFPSVKQKLYIL